MSNQQEMNFTKSINYIFYISKSIGLVCYSFTQYNKQNYLTSSVVGNIYSIVCLAAFVSFYHYIVSGTYFDGKIFDSGKFNIFKVKVNESNNLKCVF